MDGWIKLNRKITEHWLWQDAERLKWWFDLLFLAAWEEKKILHDSHLLVLHKGQMIASISYLSDRWGKSNPTIINFLRLLENEGMIYRQVLYRQTPIITICNYEKYQTQETTQIDTLIDRQVDGIVNTQVYTNKEYKEIKEININNLCEKKKSEKEKNEKALRERQEKFKLEIDAFKDNYEADMLKDFYSYWSEPNKSQTKMRYEQQPTWDLKRRLEYWERRSNQFRGRYGTGTNNNKYSSAENAERERLERQKSAYRLMQRLAAEDGGDPLPPLEQ